MSTPTALRHGVRPELVEQGLLVPIDTLTPHPDNPNNGDVDAIALSLETSGQYRPIATWRRPEGGPEVILAGNTTYAAAMLLGWTGMARTYIVADTEQEARRILLADNRYARLARMDQAQELALLRDMDDLTGTGYYPDDVDDLAATVAALESMPLDPGGAPDTGEAGPSLAQRFGVPPFSVLDARQGAWRARKRQWLALGIESELGRGAALIGGGSEQEAPAHNAQPGRHGRTSERTAAAVQRQRVGAYGAQATTGPDGRLQYETTTGATSIFDPVLAELMLRWYSREGHLVLDPWAGGSVRGIVASRLRRGYLGVELRPEQVEANRAQLGLCRPDDPPPEWVLGDAQVELRNRPANTHDFLLGCPPYFGLERYSDDPRDLSTMSVAGFEQAYSDTLGSAARMLRPDSFAALVVGNVRGPGGRMQDLVGLTIQAMGAAGCYLYNDAVLVTAVGSLPVRAGRAFVASRVLGRTHQYVLVFLKGERKRATARAGEVDLAGTLEVLDTMAESIEQEGGTG